MTMKSPRRSTIAASAAAAMLLGTIAIPLEMPAAQAAPTPLTLTPDPSYQGVPFEGWGTSLVWFANATGGYPDTVREDLYDKVFGEEGLNLNVARYNIGGGNAVDVPSYLRPGGAVDGWWNPELAASDVEGPITAEYDDRDRYAAAWDHTNPEHYDFTADATQRWWLEALSERRDDMVWEAFSNSPPYFLTDSGFVSGGINNATSEQLAVDDMEAFAGYLTTVVDRLEAEYDVDFQTLTPFNEPNTNYWQSRIGPDGWPTSASRQEGAHIGPARQDAMLKVLAAELADPGTATDVAISAMDETNPGIFATNWNAYSPEAKAIPEQLNVHTYGTGGRLVVRDIAKSAGKPLWMSEVEGDFDGTGHNLVNIDNGIGMAGRIIDDMRELEPSAWVFWQPVEDLYNMERVENLNWGSVLVDFDCDENGDSLRRIADGDADPGCEVRTNAKYNTVRNFTHYIRPGDRFIPSSNTQTAAALTADGSGATLVHVNGESTERALTVDLSKFGAIAPGATVTPIVTTQSTVEDPESNALVRGAPVAIDAATASATVVVPGDSVTTLLVEGVSGIAEEARTFEDGAQIQLVGVQSGKALTAGETGAVIRTRGSAPSSAVDQRWTVEALTGGDGDRERIALRAADGRLLAAAAGVTTLVDATREQAASDPALQWIPSTTEGRTWTLLSVSAARVAEVGGQSTAENAGVGLWTSNDGANQRWSIRSTVATGVDPVEVSTVAGVPPTLPATVVPRYADGPGAPAQVEWSTEGLDWGATGTVEVAGRAVDAFGTALEARAIVEVGGFSSTDPVSLTVAAGTPLERVIAAAPTTVPAGIASGSARYDAAVEWQWSGLGDADLVDAGVVTVSGSAASNDPAADPLPATLSLIVTEPVSTNIAPASTPSATFTESSDYGVGRTLNGITDDKGWSNWRGGTKNAVDTLTYALAERSTLQEAVVHFYRDGTNSWARSIVVEARTGDGAWSPVGDPIAVDAGAADPAPVVRIDLGGVEADDVRLVLTANDSTHMIVSEVEILASAPGPSSVAGLARLTVDGVDVEGFEAGTTQYAVESSGSRWPVVRAVPIDGDAEVLIEQAGEGDGAATVVVTAPDGTTSTTVVTIDRGIALPDPVVSGSPYVGEVLTTVASPDPGDAALAFQWTRDGEPIADATEPTYTVGEADLGTGIRVEVEAEADGFRAGSATSSAVLVTERPVAPPVVDFSAVESGALRPGDAVVVTVTGVPEGARVELQLRSTPRTLATAVADGSGTVVLRGSIPVDATAGAHQLVVLVDGVVVGETAVVVAVDGPPGGAPAAPGGDLAVTGADAGATMTLAGLALLMLLAGGPVLRRARRSGDRPTP